MAISFEPIIASNGKITNATTTDVIADTGPLASGGVYEVSVMCTGLTNTAHYEFQRRNVNNDANVGDVLTFLCPGNDPSPPTFFRIAAEAGERFRIMITVNHTGTAVATISCWRVS